mmetsp:Transcript_44540/g.72505  ORF Transcript_44540/g.72505 Transcript_44540/m.72505 type:complete len:101 (-) Transcript_44540:580-882(-)
MSERKVSYHCTHKYESIMLDHAVTCNKNTFVQSFLDETSTIYSFYMPISSADVNVPDSNWKPQARKQSACPPLTTVLHWTAPSYTISDLQVMILFGGIHT